MKFRIELDDAAVQAAFGWLVRAGTDLSPAMAAIGEHLLNTTRQRFKDQESPEGEPWKPLEEEYRKSKKRNKDKILTLYGHLRGTLAYQAGRDHVDVGSTRIYAGTHQGGAAQGAYGETRKGAPIPFGDIPARPFLGLSEADKTEINLAVRDFLAEAL